MLYASGGLTPASLALAAIKMVFQGGVTLNILKALPARLMTTELSLVMTRLTTVYLPVIGTTFSTAYKSLLHASKYGIQTFSQLEAHLRNLGISRSANNMQIHHLIEQRFRNIPGVSEWLGSNTNNWKSIVVSSVPGTGNEHNILFTQPWRQAIQHGSNPSVVGWTGANTSNATLENIKQAAKIIYADYPEILQALGLN